MYMYIYISSYKYNYTSLRKFKHTTAQDHFWHQIQPSNLIKSTSYVKSMKILRKPKVFITFSS